MVVDIKRFKRDVCISYPVGVVPGKEGVRKRGNIQRWTAASMRRLRHVMRNAPCDWVNLITLTYPGEFTTDGKEVKKQLKVFLQGLRRQEARYLWVLEFQERGAPHFHIMTDRFIDKEWVSQTWFHIVGSGDEKHLRAGTRIERANNEKDRLQRYLNSYLRKRSQKAVPDGYRSVGRFWGCSKALVTLMAEYSLEISEYASKRVFRVLRKYYEKKVREWGGKPWRWGRYRSFRCLDGSAILERLLLDINQKGGLQACLR